MAGAAGVTCGAAWFPVPRFVSSTARLAYLPDIESMAMNRKVLVGGVLAGLVAVGLAVFVAVPSGDIRQEEYATMAEAKAAGLDTRGWLPCIMPSLSSAISVGMDVDSNVSAGTFRFPAAESEQLRGALEKLRVERAIPLPREPVRPGSWPADLQSLPKPGESTQEYEYFSVTCAGEIGVFGMAVRWRDQFAAFWGNTAVNPTGK
jgi:hypothetical protein